MFALPENATIEEVWSLFKNDRYPVTTLDPQILEAGHGHAVVRMKIGENHINGFGTVMGGVLFTLADFAFGIAANIGQPPTLTASGVIDFMAKAKGDELTVSCDLDKDGRTLCFATAHVRDGEGREVARLSFVGCRTARD